MTAEVIRAGIMSLPRGQHEAALALGMRAEQAMLHVVLPQALRAALPALISVVLAIVQDTSLGYVIPYDELLHRSQDVSSYAPQSLLQAAFIVTVMYGAVSACLLFLKRWLVRRQYRAQGRSTTLLPDAAAALTAQDALATLIPDGVSGPIAGNSASHS
jgi:glutamate transport system permease protein